MAHTEEVFQEFQLASKELVTLSEQVLMTLRFQYVAQFLENQLRPLIGTNTLSASPRLSGPVGSDAEYDQLKKSQKELKSKYDTLDAEHTSVLERLKLQTQSLNETEALLNEKDISLKVPLLLWTCHSPTT